MIKINFPIFKIKIPGDKRFFLNLILITIFIITPNITLAFDSRYRFTGHELDFESSLYNFGAREYNPKIGRFLQPDPRLTDASNDNFFLNKNTEELNEFLSNPQRLNAYSYVLNNPLKYTDPNGESELLSWIFNPGLTAAQIGFWNGVANSYFKPQGNNISAMFLQHSLGLRIDNNLDMKINQTNDELNMINKVRESADYKKFISDRINEAKISGLSEISFKGGVGSERKSIQFNTGDLSTSIGKVTNIYINGKQLQDLRTLTTKYAERNKTSQHLTKPTA